jgi:predicted RND superfamily exporter protein
VPSLRLMVRLENAFGAFAVRAHRKPLAALLATAVLLGVGLWSSARLSLETDLTGLLPRSFDSVEGLEQLRKKFGGVGYVAIAGYDADEAGLKRFADEMAPKIDALEGIRFVEYKRASKFFREHALYFMNLDDLHEVEHRIKEREKYERRLKNPMYIKFDNEVVPSLDFSDIEKKYGGQSSRRLSGDGSSEYYLSPQEKMVVLLAKPSAASTDLDYSAKVVGEVEDLLARQDLKRYGPNFKVQLTGTYKKKIDQQAQIARDLSWSSTVALLLLLAYLLWHFRSVIAVGLNLAPVLVSLVWTYGLVGAIYGSVNLLTGFLAAILGGLGIEHGIHLLGRYEALRSEGASSEEATREAFTHTGGAAFISALVAAVTFLSLAISEFRAFREFGVIAAIGMMVVIGAYLLVLPALLGISARFRWKPSAASTKMTKVGWMVKLGHLLAVPRFRRIVTWVMGAGLLALALDAGRVHFNYDFSALEDSTLPSFRFDKITNRVLGYSQTPVVMLTPDAESERTIVRELSKRKAALGTDSTIDFVGALDDLVPAQQNEKQAVLASIDETLAKVKRDKLDAKTQTQFDELASMVKAQPFTRAQLPDSVRRQFLGIDEGDSGFVLVFASIETADGVLVRKFAREVRAVELVGGRRISAAGEPMILADIIEMVTREMPRILTAALVSVLLIMWLTLGSFKLAVLCLSPTMISVFALTGLMPLVGLEFNYLNIIVVPVLIGTTVDAGVHLVTRLESAGADFVSVYAETGRAITGGIMTSAVGFGAMLLADHPGLNSIGTLANLGFGTNLLVMLLGFPAFLLPLLRRRKLA